MIALLAFAGCVFVVVLPFCIHRTVNISMKFQERAALRRYLSQHGNIGSFNPNVELEEQVDLLPYTKSAEFTKDRLKMGEVIGQGAFGRVLKAEAIGLVSGESSTIVAVKTFRDGDNREQKKALISELKILIHIGKHLNIVNLLGAVTKRIMKGELLVILEYCAYGNIRHFLQKHRRSLLQQADIYAGESDEGYPSSAEQQSSDPSPSTPEVMVVGSSEENSEERIPIVTLRNLVCFCFQAARGMEYLASRKLIHRDLAARNVLLTQEKIIKICDFGLTKDCYKDPEYFKRSGELLPVKWMAIESIEDSAFSTKSDVWSFGVLMWEIYSLGSNPYPGIEMNSDFIKKLKEGYRMERPDLAPDRIYEIMKSCWLEDPSERPEFLQLVHDIGKLLQSTVRQYYLDLNEPYEEINRNLFNNGYLRMDSGTDAGYTKMVNPFKFIKGKKRSPKNMDDTYL